MCAKSMQEPRWLVLRGMIALMVAAMAFAIAVPAALASSDPVSYISYRWDWTNGCEPEEKSVESYASLESASTDVTLQDEWYVVEPGENVTINGSLIFSNERTNLVLCDGAKLTVEGGVAVAGSKLNVYGQAEGTGKLVAGVSGKIKKQHAGIGLYEKHNVEINLYGGVIEAKGGKSAAGISAGEYIGINYGKQDITVWQAQVSAEGGSFGAGIGGGYKEGGSSLTVYGGEVTATGGEGGIPSGSIFLLPYGGAGIGGGAYGHGKMAVVYGGVVTAQGGVGAAGIGGGVDGNTGLFEINRGTVTATGGSAGAGVGGGYRGGNGAIRVNGGKLIATGGYGGAGLGSGGEQVSKTMDEDHGTDVIYEGCFLQASGGGLGAEGIGKGAGSENSGRLIVDAGTLYGSDDSLESATTVVECVEKEYGKETFFPMATARYRYMTSVPGRPDGNASGTWDGASGGTQGATSGGQTTDPTGHSSSSHGSSNATVSYAQMLRLYNPNSGEHFYTSSAGERDLLVAAGWTDEGKAWRAPLTSSDPVYRLYNPNGGDHHYTTSAEERDLLVAEGWRSEGVGWYSFASSGIAVWRQYNPNALTGSHNFTTSAGERDLLVAAGWHDEGVAWYGVE